MTGAMYAAVSGLRAHMSALNVIGQNISNVNTNAYKATRYTFLEALYTTVRGGSNGSAQLGGKNPAQMGYGTSIGVRLRALRTLSVIRSGSRVVPMASTMVSKMVCISRMGMPSISRARSTFSSRA